MGKLPTAKPIPFDLISQIILSRDRSFLIESANKISKNNYSQYDVKLIAKSDPPALFILFGRFTIYIVGFRFGDKWSSSWTIIPNAPNTSAKELPQETFERFTPEQKKLYLKHIDIFSGSNEL